MIVFKAHKKPVTSLAFSPDGSLLASAAADGIRIWSAPYKSPTFSVESFHSSSITFSPAGRIVGWVGRGVWVWECSRRDPFSRATGTRSPVLLESGVYSARCCFSPDGKVFVAQRSESSLIRWDASTWKELPGGWGGTRNSTEGKRFSLSCVAYHPDGKTLATGYGVHTDAGWSSVIFLWDAKSGKQRAALGCQAEFAHPEEITFSPDGQVIAGLYGPNLRIWNISESRQIAARKVGKKHFKGLAFTPDGARLVTVSNDETVRLWDTSSWDEVEGFEWKIGKLACVAVSPDGMRMAAGGSTGKVVLWDVD